MNEEEAKKAGWYDRRQDPKKLEAWAEKAYPNINVELLEISFEKEKILEALRKF